MPVDKGQIGGILGAMSILMIIMGLIMNNLSGQPTYKNSANESLSTTCGWNYMKICSPQCNRYSFETGCVDDNDSGSCQTRNAGLIYIIFLILTLILSLIAVLGVFVSYFNQKVQHIIRYLFLCCGLLCLLVVLVWVIVGEKSKYCYDSEWNKRYLGGSIILPIISIFFYFIAMILVWKQHKVGYETLL